VTTLVVLQPGYLPWLGYFDLLNKADVFVQYDDVQFDKYDWRPFTAPGLSRSSPLPLSFKMSLAGHRQQRAALIQREATN
jgi:WbqC-like protein family